MIKSEILKILGKNHITPCVMENQETEAIYTYKNNVYCLNMGRDFEFDNLSNKGKENILIAIKNKKYKRSNFSMMELLI